MEFDKREEPLRSPLGRLKENAVNAVLLGELLTLACDYIAILIAAGAACCARGFLMGGDGVYDYYLSVNFTYIIIPLSFISIMYLNGLYSPVSQFWSVIEKIFKSAFWAAAFLILLQYARHDAASISRLFIVLFGFFSFILLVAFRYVVKKSLSKSNIFKTKTLLVGGGGLINTMIPRLSASLGVNYDFVGVLSDDASQSQKIAGTEIIGRSADLEETIDALGVQHVIVFAQNMAPGKLCKIVNAAQPLVSSVAVMPDMVGLPLGNISVERFYEDKITMLNIRNNLSNRFYVFIKSVIEWIVTFAGTIVISPFLILIALWIYKDSPGPVIFKHRRIGRGGKEFDCIKFRSMCVDAKEKLAEILANDPDARAEWDRDYKLKNDPRITKSGAFLRKTSLDELPQIINVLKGEMSLVGPRPIVTDEIPRYKEYITDYYMVRPGITGLWQVSGRNDIDYTERVEMDSWYVRNWSIWIDIVILFRTFKVALKGKGAY